MPTSMTEPSLIENRAPAAVYVDADLGQRRLLEVQFAVRFQVTVAASATGLPEQVGSVAPVAALLASSSSARWCARYGHAWTRPNGSRRWAG